MIEVQAPVCITAACLTRHCLQDALEPHISKVTLCLFNCSSFFQDTTKSVLLIVDYCQQNSMLSAPGHPECALGQASPYLRHQS